LHEFGDLSELPQESRYSGGSLYDMWWPTVLFYLALRQDLLVLHADVTACDRVPSTWSIHLQPSSVLGATAHALRAFRRIAEDSMRVPRIATSTIDTGQSAKPAELDEATPEELSKEGYPTPDNYERDKWLYEQKKRGVTVPRLVSELLNEFYVNVLDWEPIGESGIRNAIQRYCKHFPLDFPKGRSGRPKETVEPERPSA
jgi:hypothetical protein